MPYTKSIFQSVGHARFEDYCKERWGMERRHAYRLMEAAEVAKVSTVVEVSSERHARELAPTIHATTGDLSPTYMSMRLDVPRPYRATE